MTDLREAIRVRTLRRMRQALTETDVSLERLLADGRLPGDAQVQEAAASRDSLVTSITEVTGRSDGTTYPPEAIRVLEGMRPLRRPHERPFFIRHVGRIGRAIERHHPQRDALQSVHNTL